MFHHSIKQRHAFIIEMNADLTHCQAYYTQNSVYYNKCFSKKRPVIYHFKNLHFNQPALEMKNKTFTSFYKHQWIRKLSKFHFRFETSSKWTFASKRDIFILIQFTCLHVNYLSDRNELWFLRKVTCGKIWKLWLLSPSFRLGI